MIEIGSFSLLVALCISLSVMIFLFIGINRQDWRYIEISCRATKAIFLFMTLSVGILIYAFIKDDFRIEYVSSFSEVSLPVFFAGIL
jgi:cytochrome c-type biogenesis protein CcmF